MKLKFSNFILRSIPFKWVRYLLEYHYGSHYKINYSQEGEDQVLKRIFENQNSGFYVDIGAYHPFKYSNTMHFYRQGWRGINIDASKNSMVEFNKHRPKDINIELAVSDQIEQSKEFFIFNNNTLNTFNEKEAKAKNGVKGWRIIEISKIPVMRLDKILDMHSEEFIEIDFMSIDVEGHEFQVLKSNNWTKYSPKILIIELLRMTIAEIMKNEITLFLAQRNYTIFAKTVNSVFYVRNDFQIKINSLI